ncbi:4'-phosphopantetheinyl transferase family protein [Leifsonia shinshuensis]|uniref:4'-phosphopantetheinyl transferase n=1 Tax=Leifsonia shinshuensis TaxID=150026 RepID=A0A853CSW4_9MICO|nr:4'-phosphopantetheinyl transferase superfamily protein [Leifsonia shinshuensis]NYJ23452.1 4'-phosphopantetheinyl transferase [Leifsonia shinshuensis]
MELSTVVVAPTRRVLAVLPRAPLGAAAETRLRRLRSAADRDDVTAARLLAAHVLSAVTGGEVAPAELRQRCEVCGGEHGLPLPVAGLQVSWSHAHGWVAAGASGSRLGVDVEADGEVNLADALTPTERTLVGAASDSARAFRLAWTAKEACVKAGVARLDGFAGLDVLAAPDALRPSHGDLLLSRRLLSGAVASAATAEPARWATLGDGGELVPAPDRVVGTPA